MCPTVVSEPYLPSVQSAAMAHFAFCGLIRQGLVPVLQRGQSGTTVGL